jgi:hypothetical protein
MDYQFPAIGGDCGRPGSEPFGDSVAEVSVVWIPLRLFRSSFINLIDIKFF